MSNVEAMRGVFGMMLGVTTMIVVPSIIVYVRRRNKHPIEGRPFVILLVHQIFIYVYIISYCTIAMVGDPGYPCLLKYTLNELPGIIVITTYAFRSWFLLIRIGIENAKLDYHTSQEEGHKFLNWLLRHRYLTRQRNLWIIYFSIIFLTYIKGYVSVFMWIHQGTYDMYGDCDAQHSNANSSVNFFVAGIEILLTTVAAWKLRASREGFYIKSELKMTAIILVIMFALFILFDAVEPEEFKVKYLVIVIGMTFVFMTCSTYPIYRSYDKGAPKPSFDEFMIMVLQHNAEFEEYKDEDELSTSEESRSVCLLDVLKFSPTRNLFLRHCELEFTAENVLFWEAARDYSEDEGRDDQKQNELFMSIFSTYIHLHAPLSINVSYEGRMAVCKIAGELNGSEELSSTAATGNLPPIDFNGVAKSNVFETLQFEVYHLMSFDIYPRFVISVEAEVEEIARMTELETLQSLPTGSGNRVGGGGTTRSTDNGQKVSSMMDSANSTTNLIKYV